MSEHTNGVVITTEIGRPRGRGVPDYPSVVMPTSGYTARVRRMATGTMANLRQQAYKELEGERPAPPVQQVEVGPPARPGEPAATAAVERTSDPDYVEALKAWENRVNQAAAMKWLKVVQGYALLTPTDDEAVAAYREAMAAVGVEVAGDDREIFVWSILAPTPEDQRLLTAFILGISEPSREAVQAHQETFRGPVPGAAPGEVPDAGGAE